jgi:hypothetical protein
MELEYSSRELCFRSNGGGLALRFVQGCDFLLLPILFAKGAKKVGAPGSDLENADEEFRDLQLLVVGRARMRRLTENVRREHTYDVGKSPCVTRLRSAVSTPIGLSATQF